MPGAVYLTGAAATFLTGAAIMLRIVERDFAKRNEFCAATIGGLWLVAVAALLWPITVPIAILYRAAGWWWDRRHRATRAADDDIPWITP